MTTTTILTLRATKQYSCISVVNVPSPSSASSNNSKPKTFHSWLNNNKFSSLPTIVFTTRCGRLPNITPDAWEHMLNEQKLSHNGNNQSSFCLSLAIDTVEDYVPLLTSAGMDVFDFFALERDQVFVIATCRDTTLRARGTTAMPFIPSTTWGTLGVDAWIIPGDAIHLDSGSNRSKLALPNTLSSYRNSSYNGLGFATVIGNNEQMVKECIRELINHKNGAVIPAGFALDVATRELTVLALQILVQSETTRDRPRLVFGGCAGPIDVIQWFLNGAQLVETSYPEVMSRLGIALEFNLATNVHSLEELFFGQGDDGIKLDVRSCGEKDSTSLVVGCRCFACVHHTRGYIRHLVISHEMLGESLLMAHNVFMMDKFAWWLREQWDGVGV